MNTVTTNTKAFPKMTQAQAMIGMFRSMSKKARTEFATWFFQNVEMDVTQSAAYKASMRDIEEGRVTEFNSMEDFKNWCEKL